MICESQTFKPGLCLNDKQNKWLCVISLKKVDETLYDQKAAYTLSI